MESKADNIIDYIPMPLISSKEGEDGNVTLLKPRFKAFWLRRLSIKLGKPDTLKIHLDARGSEVWRLIDGARTIESIAMALPDRADEPYESKLNRLVHFMHMLMRNQFIRLQKFVY